METSGFTEEQLTVREAIQKICSNFPDVRPGSSLKPDEALIVETRNIGLNMMKMPSIRTSSTLLCPRMDGLGLPFLKI